MRCRTTPTVAGGGNQKSKYGSFASAIVTKSCPKTSIPLHSSVRKSLKRQGALSPRELLHGCRGCHQTHIKFSPRKRGSANFLASSRTHTHPPLVCRETVGFCIRCRGCPLLYLGINFLSPYLESNQVRDDLVHQGDVSPSSPYLLREIVLLCPHLPRWGCPVLGGVDPLKMS